MAVVSKKSHQELVNSDARAKRVFAVIAKHRGRHDALIEVLHAVQDVYGYISPEMMRFVSDEMKISPSRIYGVATFYHFFSLKPKGEHTCTVCTGTACHVKGAGEVIQKIEEDFGLKAGATTADGKLGLQTARCLGCCSLAPVVVMDEEVLANVTKDEISEKVRKHLEEKEIQNEG